MDELINRLTTQAGITNEQAEKVLDTLKDFITEKFPMFGGAVDGLLNGNNGDRDDDPMP